MPDCYHVHVNLLNLDTLMLYWSLTQLHKNFLTLYVNHKTYEIIWRHTIEIRNVNMKETSGKLIPFFLVLQYELKYPALLGIQDKVEEFEWLIMFIFHRNVSVTMTHYPIVMQQGNNTYSFLLNIHTYRQTDTLSLLFIRFSRASKKLMKQEINRNILQTDPSYRASYVYYDMNIQCTPVAYLWSRLWRRWSLCIIKITVRSHSNTYCSNNSRSIVARHVTTPIGWAIHYVTCKKQNTDIV
jgi:hypothetical protein